MVNRLLGESKVSDDVKKLVFELSMRRLFPGSESKRKSKRKTTMGFQPGHQIRSSRNSRDEANWDAILEVVKLFKQNLGRFPKGGGDRYERKLYHWLRRCSDRTMPNWTQERANKLVLAFGDRWQSECFPNSIRFW